MNTFIWSKDLTGYQNYKALCNFQNHHKLLDSDFIRVENSEGVIYEFKILLGEYKILIKAYSSSLVEI